MASGTNGPTGVHVPRPVLTVRCSEHENVTGLRTGAWSVRASGSNRGIASQNCVLWMANGSPGAPGLVVAKHVAEEANREKGFAMGPTMMESHAQGTERKLDVAMRRSVQVRSSMLLRQSLLQFVLKVGWVI